MATKLKKLSITSVDLVNAGANPDAHIRLYKSKDAPHEPPGDDGANANPSDGFIKNLVLGIVQRLGIKAPEDVTKEAETFSDKMTEVQFRRVTSEIWDYIYAFSDSLSSIVCDGDMEAQQKRDMLMQSIEEFTGIMRIAAGNWSKGEMAQNGEESENNNEEVMETMKIDKSKMSAEEIAVLEEFEKKYGAEEEPPAAPVGEPADCDANPTSDEGIAKGSAELHPEVKKALDEVAELKKSLALEQLTGLAKKYEILGKQPEELAKKLFDMKNAGGTAYDDYVNLLDEQVSMYENTGIFSEVGKNTSGAGSAHTKIEKAATELQKVDSSLSREAAFVKACENNPQLLAEYENEL